MRILSCKRKWKWFFCKNRNNVTWKIQLILRRDLQVDFEQHLAWDTKQKWNILAKLKEANHLHFWRNYLRVACVWGCSCAKVLILTKRCSGKDLGSSSLALHGKRFKALNNGDKQKWRLVPEIITIKFSQIPFLNTFFNHNSRNKNLRGPSKEDSLSGVAMSAWGEGPSMGAGW